MWSRQVRDRCRCSVGRRHRVHPRDLPIHCELWRWSTQARIPTMPCCRQRLQLFLKKPSSELPLFSMVPDSRFLNLVESMRGRSLRDWDQDQTWAIALETFATRAGVRFAGLLWRNRPPDWCCSTCLQRVHNPSQRPLRARVHCQWQG